MEHLQPVGLSMIVGAVRRSEAETAARMRLLREASPFVGNPILHIGECIGIDDATGLRAYEVVVLVGFEERSDS